MSTDSRRIEPGALFVALRGPRFDGHAFVAAAVAAGAGAVMVDAAAAAAGVAEGLQAAALVVPDTVAALGAMGAWWRRSLQLTVLGVTGSNGKTSTKELIAAALSAAGKVHKTAGNFNNFVGVPLTLLACPPDARFAVVEMGMNAPREIAQLAAMARPQVGVVTCVDLAHLGGIGLGSLDAIARAKAEMYAALGPGATAVINRDDPALAAALPNPWPTQVRQLGFGRDASAQICLTQTHAEPTGNRLTLQVAGEAVAVHLPLWGPHQAMNAAAAAAVAHALGLAPAAWAPALAAVQLPPGRCQVRRRRDGVTVIDDSYNANPGSLRAAGRTLLELAGRGRTLMVVGDMLELGEGAEALHREAGIALAAMGVGEIFTLGPLAEALGTAAARAGAQAHSFAQMPPLVAALGQVLRPGDWLVVKGSRGMRMERVVAALFGAAA